MILEFRTLILIAGSAVLLVAIAVGERMGDRVLGEATERTLESVPAVSLTAAPNGTPQAYGPDWKRSEALSAASDPRFPDPRVPPAPLPTPLPPPPPKPTPPPTATPNPNIPIWRRQPLPTPSAQESPSEGPSEAEPSPAVSASPAAHF